RISATDHGLSSDPIIEAEPGSPVVSIARRNRTKYVARIAARGCHDFSIQARYSREQASGTFVADTVCKCEPRSNTPLILSEKSVVVIPGQIKRRAAGQRAVDSSQIRTIVDEILQNQQPSARRHVALSDQVLRL